MADEGFNIDLHIVSCNWIVLSLRNPWEGWEIAKCFFSLRGFWNILKHCFGLVDYLQLLPLLSLFRHFFTFLSACIFCDSSSISVSSEAWGWPYRLTQSLLPFGKSRIGSNGWIRFLFQWFRWLLFLNSSFFLTRVSSCWIRRS